MIVLQCARTDSPRFPSSLRGRCSRCQSPVWVSRAAQELAAKETVRAVCERCQPAQALTPSVPCTCEMCVKSRMR